MEAPRVTYYARVLDNITGEEILKYTSVSKNNTWYYGQCNALTGGESQYIVEFDIWNNEPAFNAGQYDLHVSDAKNCRLTVWSDKDCKIKDNELFNLESSFMQARCVNNNYNEQFTGIKQNAMLKNITGNVNPSRVGVLHGNGDHTKIQTKIVLNQNSKLSTTRHGFIFAFYYDF